VTSAQPLRSRFSSPPNSTAASTAGPGRQRTGTSRSGCPMISAIQPAGCGHHGPPAGRETRWISGPLAGVNRAAGAKAGTSPACCGGGVDRFRAAFRRGYGNGKRRGAVRYGDQRFERGQSSETHQSRQRYPASRRQSSRYDLFERARHCDQARTKRSRSPSGIPEQRERCTRPTPRSPPFPGGRPAGKNAAGQNADPLPPTYCARVNRSRVRTCAQAVAASHSA
jgi:hypothetical protein